MSSTADYLDKLEFRKEKLVEKLDKEGKVLDTLFCTLSERIRRLQIEEAIILSYLEDPNAPQNPFSGFALSTYGYKDDQESNKDEDNDQDDWNNYSHDDNDSQYEDSDEPQDAPSISGDDLDEGTSDQEALDALLEQYDQD